MCWKWNFKILMIILLSIYLVIIGTNVTTMRLAVITNKEIMIPFSMEKGGKEEIQVNILGKQYGYSYTPLLNKYTTAKDSIQNSWVTVKCNLAPRFEYLDNLWLKGITKLDNDFQIITQNLSNIKKGE